MVECNLLNWNYDCINWANFCLPRVGMCCFKNSQPHETKTKRIKIYNRIVKMHCICGQPQWPNWFMNGSHWQNCESNSNRTIAITHLPNLIMSSFTSLYWQLTHANENTIYLFSFCIWMYKIHILHIFHKL